MAKKETLNPLTAFRKANEARKAVVMKSLKKAQEGIAQDTSAAQTLYKKYKPWEGKVNFDNLDPLRNVQLSNQQDTRKAEMNNQSNARMSSSAASFEGPKSISTKSNKSASDILNSYNKKKGGSTKSKKR
jgi:hypothetical protein